mgnify:CR=1 FL=1
MGSACSGAQASCCHCPGGNGRMRLHRFRSALGRARRDAGYALGLVKAVRVAPPCHPRVEVEAEGRLSGLAPFLAGTQSGLLYVEGGRAWRLHGGSVYGLASNRDPRRWYVFQRVPQSFGRLLRVDLEKGTARSLAGFLSTGVHQVDVVDGRLVVMDTYRNGIAHYSERGKRLRTVYPSGPVADGRDSANYRHFNSLFAAPDAVYVLAHNQSAKTGMDSEIFVLDRTWQTIRVIPTGSGSAHNVAEIDGRLWHCDSRGGGLVVGRKTVFQETDLFTRGLAVNRTHVLVGGSQITEREHRGRTDGEVIVLDRAFEPQGRMRFSRSGGVQEIRFLQGDLAMSSTGAS